MLLNSHHCKNPEDGLLRPEQRMAKIGLVSNYNGPDQPMQVSFFSVCTEKKDGEIETEISVVRTQVYHLPKEPWFELMWMKGTPIPPSFYEEIRNHKSVREMVALGEKKSKRKGFGANASNPFLVMIQSKL